MTVYIGQVNNSTSGFLGYCVYRRCVKKLCAVPSHSTCLCVLIKRGPSLAIDQSSLWPCAEYCPIRFAMFITFTFVFVLPVLCVVTVVQK